MKCYVHNEIDAEYYCQVCGKPCCKECIISENKHYWCADCKEQKIEKDLDGVKSPVIAFLLSFFIPGTGQLYNAQYLKGVSIIASFIGILVMAAENVVIWDYNDKLSFVVLVVLAAFIIWIFSLIDAYHEADKLRKGIDDSNAQLSFFWGAVLVIVGVFLLLLNFQVMPLAYLHKLWPTIFVVIGIRFIIKAYVYYAKGAKNE